MGGKKGREATYPKDDSSSTAASADTCPAAHPEYYSTTAHNSDLDSS